MTPSVTASGRFPFRMSAGAALVALALGGCAVQPSAPDKAAYQAQVQQLRQRLFSAQEKIAAPITLADATARALKYNMDYRVHMMEQALALGQLDVANYDLLPKLTVNAGYSTRSNDSFGFGFGPDGNISSNPTASQERTRRTASVGFAWNVLDFGLSYVRAKQLADQSLIADERRRKAQQNLVQDVRQAWWRAEAAQRLLPQIDALLDEIDRTTARARLIETRRLLPPLQIVAYRRSLLDLEQQLSARRQELAQAQVELAALMNVPPGTKYTLADGHSGDFVAPELTTSIAALEETTLENRPELREETYKKRIGKLEWKKQVLGLLPNFGIESALNYDSNRYLLNNEWGSAGLNLSFGLLKLFSLPAMQRNQQAQEQVDDTRALAVTAAILAQTRLAAVRYTLLAHEYGVWDEAAKDDHRIVRYLESSKQVGLETELELVRARARALVSTVQRDFVHANLEASIGRLYNSIGLDALPDSMASTDAGSLAQTLDRQIGRWRHANFAEAPLPSFGSFALDPIVGVPADSNALFRDSMLRILRLSKVALARDGNAKVHLQTEVKLAPRQSSGQPAQVMLRVTDTAGKLIAESKQSTMLLDPITRDQWQALAEGAAYRMVGPLRQALHETPAQTASNTESK